MGFTVHNYTDDYPILPSDCNILRRLEPDIIGILKLASSSLSHNINPNIYHAANHYNKVWFGDNDPEWITLLKFKLNRMAAILEHHPIYVHRVPLQARPPGYAIAISPTHGWQDYTADNNGLDFIARSRNQNFEILLGELWPAAPMYRLCDRHSVPLQIEPQMPNDQLRSSYHNCTHNHDSKFQILVHELSHLMHDTEDNEYGYDKTMNLAESDSNSAKVNADNWGYFLEEFRVHMKTQESFYI